MQCYYYCELIQQGNASLSYPPIHSQIWAGQVLLVGTEKRVAQNGPHYLTFFSFSSYGILSSVTCAYRKRKSE